MQPFAFLQPLQPNQERPFDHQWLPFDRLQLP